jgi:hypothetical protein
MGTFETSSAVLLSTTPMTTAIEETLIIDKTQQMNLTIRDTIELFSPSKRKTLASQGVDSSFGRRSLYDQIYKPSSIRRHRLSDLERSQDSMVNQEPGDEVD